MWRGIGLWLVIPKLSHAAPAEAPGPTVPLATQLVLEPSSCVERALLQGKVGARSPRIVFIEEPAPRTVWVRFPATDAEGELRAEVVLSAEPNAKLTRDLWAQDCLELVDAIAFVISVTLDPPAPPALPGPAGNQDAVGLDGAGLSENRAESDGAPVLSATAQGSGDQGEALSSFPAGQATAGSTSAGPPRPRLFVGLGGAMTRGPAPDPMWGGSGVFEVTWAPTEATISGHTLRFGAAALLSPDYAAQGGIASFGLFSAGAEACPLALLHFERGSVSPCARLRAGALRARGSATVAPEGKTLPWVEAGGSLLGSLLVTKNWRVDAAVGVGKPLLTYAFQFEPVVFYQVSRWTVDLGLHVSTAL